MVKSLVALSALIAAATGTTEGLRYVPFNVTGRAPAFTTGTGSPVATTSSQTFPAERPDRIVIDKSEKSLRLFAGKIEVQKFNVALGSAAGPKCVQGDRRTPEGRYTVIGKLSKSAYHKALRLSYPERKDVDCAKTQNRQPGGDIMIHGLPNGRGFFGAVHHLKNWTQGCIAVRNDEIDYLFNVIRVGTVVEIIP